MDFEMLFALSLLLNSLMLQDGQLMNTAYYIQEHDADVETDEENNEDEPIMIGWKNNVKGKLYQVAANKKLEDEIELDDKAEGEFVNRLEKDFSDENMVRVVGEIAQDLGLNVNVSINR